MERQSKLSGILATIVFVVMAVSDLLILTRLDFTRPYMFWRDAKYIPDAQVVLGYYLGVLTMPFNIATAWHLSLAVRPRWAARLLVVTTAYSVPLLTVWHASFAF